MKNRIYDEFFEEIDGQQHDERREINASQEREPPSDLEQYRFGDFVEEVDDGVVGIGIHPGDKCTGYDDVHVEGEYNIKYSPDCRQKISRNEQFFHPACIECNKNRNFYTENRMGCQGQRGVGLIGTAAEWW